MNYHKQENSQQLTYLKTFTREYLADQRSAYYKKFDKDSCRLYHLYHNALIEKTLDEAKAQFKPWNKNISKDINLRYLYRKDVYDVLDEILVYIEDFYKYRTHDKKLVYEIIVGYGYGSKNYICQLHSEVSDYLWDYGIPNDDHYTKFLAYLDV